MSSDPFNIVRDELKKSISKTKSLIESYNAVLNAKNGEDDNDTTSKLLGDIRTNLKSINWDVQDLEETIKIASKNPARFNLTNSEIENRNQFIDQTKEFIQKTKQLYNIDFDDKSVTLSGSSKKFSSNNNSNSQTNINIRIPDIISNTTTNKTASESKKLVANDDSESDYDVSYARKGFAKANSAAANLNNRSPEHHAIQMQHQEMFKEQDKSIDLISGRVSSLKNISQAMQNELDDQAQLLDDLGREMDTADSRMNNVMKRITKVLHMSSDKRQWTLIGVLLLAILIVIILFAIL